MRRAEVPRKDLSSRQARAVVVDTIPGGKGYQHRSRLASGSADGEINPPGSKTIPHRVPRAERDRIAHHGREFHPGHLDERGCEVPGNPRAQYPDHRGRSAGNPCGHLGRAGGDVHGCRGGSEPGGFSGTDRIWLNIRQDNPTKYRVSESLSYMRSVDIQFEATDDSSPR